MSEVIDQVSLKENVKRQRFVRIVESRVNKILTNLDNLGRCSNKRNYEYSQDEVRRIFREIDRKVKEVRRQFESTNGRNSRFKL